MKSSPDLLLAGGCAELDMLTSLERRAYVVLLLLSVLSGGGGGRPGSSLPFLPRCFLITLVNETELRLSLDLPRFSLDLCFRRSPGSATMLYFRLQISATLAQSVYGGQLVRRLFCATPNTASQRDTRPQLLFPLSTCYRVPRKKAA